MNNYRDKYHRRSPMSEFLEYTSTYGTNRFSDQRAASIYKRFSDSLSTQIADDGSTMKLAKEASKEYRDNFENDFNELLRLRNLILVPGDAFSYVTEVPVDFNTAFQSDLANSWAKKDDLISFFEANNNEEALKTVRRYPRNNIFLDKLDSLFSDSDLSLEQCLDGFKNVSQGEVKNLTVLERMRIGFSSDRIKAFYDIVLPGYSEFDMKKPPLHHIIKQEMVDELYEKGFINEQLRDLLIKSSNNLSPHQNPITHIMLGHGGNFRDRVPADLALERLHEITEKYNNTMESVKDRLDFEQDTIYLSFLYIAMDSLSRRKMYGSNLVSARQKLASFGVFASRSIGLVAAGQGLEKIQYGIIDKHYESFFTADILGADVLKEYIDDNPYLNIKLIKSFGMGVKKYRNSRDLRQSGGIVLEGLTEYGIMTIFVFALGPYGMPVYLAGKNLYTHGSQLYVNDKYHKKWKDHMFEQATKSASIH